MVGFNILIVRAFEQEYPDNRLYPQLSDQEDQIVAAEPADGTNMMSFSGSYAVVWDLQGRVRTKLAETFGPTSGFVSDCRVGVSCENFTKDSAWVGAGPGAVIAAGAMAVSAAKGRGRRKGKIMVGHLRYEWITRIGASPGKHLSLGYVANGVPKAMEMYVNGGISVIMAQDLARRVAVSRLKENPGLPAEQRSFLEKLREAGPLRPTVRKWDYYEIPGGVMVRTAVKP
jgi:hypothetical protein